MKYALLVHQPQEYFDRRKEAASIAAGMAYGEALRGAGVLVTGAGLKSPQTATTVSVRDGKRHVHDGPYAETKEFLAGFAIIDVPDLDAALEWAARHPAANFTAQSNGGYGSETAWSGSGGGISQIFGIPSYQQGVSGLASSTHRNVPDVSFPSYYTDTFVNRRWVGLEGTSWSSPIYVALQLEMNQMRNQRFGLVNTNIYRVPEQNFHDISHGSNGEYSAKGGYDNVTGRGSPRGVPLGGSL